MDLRRALNEELRQDGAGFTLDGRYDFGVDAVHVPAVAVRGADADVADVFGCRAVVRLFDVRFEPIRRAAAAVAAFDQGGRRLGVAAAGVCCVGTGVGVGWRVRRVGRRAFEGPL